MEPHDKDWVVAGSSPEEMTRLDLNQLQGLSCFSSSDTKEEYALARTEENWQGIMGLSSTMIPQ